MTIIEAAISVLSKTQDPLSAQIIYEEICKQNLFTFGAKKPLTVLQAELRRHSTGYTGKNPPLAPKLQQHSDKTYSIM
jgi:hypothetical protein